jgi:hypothetical protein
LFNKAIANDSTLNGDLQEMKSIVNKVKDLVEQMETATSSQKKAQLMYDANMWEFKARELLYDLLK